MYGCIRTCLCIVGCCLVSVGSFASLQITDLYEVAQGNVVLTTSLPSPLAGDGLGVRGKITNQYIYSPYGIQKNLNDLRLNSPRSLNITHNQFGYTGQTLDPSTKLMLLGGFRNYAPGIGRFIQPDTYNSFSKQHINNAFAYVKANPMSYVDSTGHNPLTFASLMEQFNPEAIAESWLTTIDEPLESLRHFVCLVKQKGTPIDALLNDVNVLTLWGDGEGVFSAAYDKAAARNGIEIAGKKGNLAKEDPVKFQAEDGVWWVKKVHADESDAQYHAYIGNRVFYRVGLGPVIHYEGCFTYTPLADSVGNINDPAFDLEAVSKSLLDRGITMADPKPENFGRFGDVWVPIDFDTVVILGDSRSRELIARWNFEAGYIEGLRSWSDQLGENQRLARGWLIHYDWAKRSTRLSEDATSFLRILYTRITVRASVVKAL